jgi:peptide/nickel transport system substrate-binding protein
MLTQATAASPRHLAARLTAMLLAAAMIFAACGSGGDDPGASASSTTAASANLPALDNVNIRLEGDWPHLDPTGRTPGGGLQTQVLTNLLYDSLVVIGPDPKDPKKPILLPYLAESWDATPSKVSFKIKKGVTCADGTPVTPSVVKRNLDVRLAAKTGVAQAYGAGPFETVADDAAGTFTLNMGSPYYDALYAFIELRIVCPTGLDDGASIVNGAAGSGPYTLVSAEHGNQAVLKRREDWKWGPNGITAKNIPAQVTAKVVTNETTAANLLLTGGLDVSKVGGADVPRLKGDKSLVNATTVSFYNNTLIFSMDPAHPTADKVVRQALSTAIDRESWNQAANQGRGTPSTSFLQPKADCYEPKTKDLAPKNPSADAARKILTDAGWTAGANGKLQKNGQPLTVILVSTTITGLGNGGEYLAAQWDKAGVTVDTRITGDYNTFLQRGIKGEFDALTTNYPFDQPNPNRAVGTYTGPVASSWSKGPTPEIDAEIALAQQNEGAKRCEHWMKAQRMLLEGFNIYPLASPEVNWFTRGITVFPGASWTNPIYFRRAK